MLFEFARAHCNAPRIQAFESVGQPVVWKPELTHLSNDFLQ